MKRKIDYYVKLFNRHGPVMVIAYLVGVIAELRREIAELKQGRKVTPLPL
jgi:hypothetical protein